MGRGPYASAAVMGRGPYASAAVLGRRPYATAALLAAALVLSACIGDSEVRPSALAGSAGAPSSDGAAARLSDQQQAAWVEETLASLTVEEKVGQLFVARVHGTSADTQDPEAVDQNRAELGVDNAVQLVAAYRVGGIVYFGENVTTPEALARFGNAVQEAASQQRVVIPVVTSIDQEQGSVARIGPPATQFPGSMALGAGRSAEDAHRAALITGQELRAMGVFQDFAPVSDVNADPSNPVIGVRSFGSRPALVSTMVEAQVRGYQEAGIAATAKHFPGHGDTSVDSHTGLPEITNDRASLRRVDLKPFRAAIAEGVDAIMTAHITVPALDPTGTPATLSKPVLTGLLRDQLGFDGVIITDSLRMEGVRTTYGDDRVPVLAILAGADQLLDPPDLPLAYASVLTAVGNEEITIDRLDASVRRVLALKARLGLMSASAASVDTALVESSVGRPDSLATAASITDRTTTLVRDPRGLVPAAGLDGASVLVVGWGETTTQRLADALRARGSVVSVQETGDAPGPEEIATAVAAARTVDLVVAVTHDVSVHREQATLLSGLDGTGRPVVAAGVGTPYDVAWLPDDMAYLAAYSFQPVALESLVRVIAGDVRPSGRLPVSIPSASDPAVVLYPFGWPSAGSVAEE